MESWAQRLERVLEIYRRDDGSRWSGAAIERATNGRVSRFYFSEIHRGENKDPGFDKIAEISKGTGIPLEAFLGEEENDEGTEQR